MSEQNDQVNKPEEIIESIVRPIGERVIVKGGRDYLPPDVRVIPNTYSESNDNEKAVHISQGKAGISLSLPTLEMIVAWLKAKA